jgi:hypothetical protein
MGNFMVSLLSSSPDVPPLLFFLLLLLFAVCCLVLPTPLSEARILVGQLGASRGPKSA